MSQFLSKFDLSEIQWYVILKKKIKRLVYSLSDKEVTFYLFLLSRFTPEDYIKCLVKYKPVTLFVVPSLLAFLATHPLVKKEHIESVETIMVGAAPTTDSMVEKFLLKCEKTKDEIRLLQGLYLHSKR